MKLSPLFRKIVEVQMKDEARAVLSNHAFFMMLFYFAV
jgi:hypothetical protein